MPKTTNRLNYERKKDPLKRLVVSIQAENGYSADEMANLFGISKSTYFRLMNLPSSEWITEAVKGLKKAGVPIEEIRQAIR